MADSPAPLFHSAPAPTRRGRPPGSKAKVIVDPRSLGVHHFAFVRSNLLGLDLREAFNRYLAWSETTTDLRYIQNRCDALLKQVIEAGRHWDAGQPAHAKIGYLLDLLRTNASVKAAVALPSLDEWVDAEGMDPDAWSEADLLAEYKAAFGLDNADALEAAEGIKDPAAERVKALNYLETILAVTPTPTDRLEVWFARPVVKCLRNVGLLTLGDLVRFVNVYGYRWYGRISGFGARRAGLVLAWLRMQEEALNLAISPAAVESKSMRVLQASPGSITPYPALANSQLSQFGSGTLVQLGLSRMQGAALSGETGEFRSHMANTLGARNDLDAVNSWLERYNEKPSTQRSYRKEVERFLLWCAQELKKPLSSVNGPDCLRYREFLKAVPALWIHPVPVARTDPQWRAFRGQPSPASQKQALVILQTMFTGLVDAGYLVANPMRSVMKGFDLPASKVDTRRSFSNAEWTHVLSCLGAISDGPEKLRLRCILALLITTGLRLHELAHARHCDIRLEALPELPETWIITVTGKRRKNRDVPLQPEVVELLASHRQAYLTQNSQNSDCHSQPLIMTLHSSVPQWILNEHGEPQSVAISNTPGAALSASGIYNVLKRFFGSAATSAKDAGLDPKRFKSASTHWLRHTYAKNAIEDKVPVEIVSELLGHASIDTTSIYTKQELVRKVQASRAMRRPTV